MPTTTRISNADWIIAWDETSGDHVYLKNADLVFTDNEIDFVGTGYAGDVDTEIDGRGSCLMPGLVNIHSHPNH